MVSIGISCIAFVFTLRSSTSCGPHCIRRGDPRQALHQQHLRCLRRDTISPHGRLLPVSSHMHMLLDFQLRFHLTEIFHFHLLKFTTTHNSQFPIHLHILDYHPQNRPRHWNRLPNSSCMLFDASRNALPGSLHLRRLQIKLHNPLIQFHTDHHFRLLQDQDLSHLLQALHISTPPPQTPPPAGTPPPDSATSKPQPVKRTPLRLTTTKMKADINKLLDSRLNQFTTALQATLRSSTATPSSTSTPPPHKDEPHRPPRRRASRTITPTPQQTRSAPLPQTSSHHRHASPHQSRSPQPRT